MIKEFSIKNKLFGKPKYCSSILHSKEPYACRKMEELKINTDIFLLTWNTIRLLEYTDVFSFVEIERCFCCTSNSSSAADDN